MDAPPITAQAAAYLRAIDHRTRLEPFTGIEMPSAYAVLATMRRLRTERGESVVGRKIGFTNRTIWDEYNVFAPIWGYMYSSTLCDAAAARDVDLARFVEPRIEPEIAFRFARPPEAGMAPPDLLDCVEWVAHGVEIVQSHYPDWTFSPADTVATNALHGAYILGEPAPVVDRDAWLAPLASFEISLFRDGAFVDKGHARNVLDGPLFAVAALLDLLKADPDNPPVAAGEIITTGTVTRAFPIAAGQVWRTQVHGLPLPGLEITCACPASGGANVGQRIHPGDRTG